MRRNLELEATIVEKYAAVEAYLDERGRRIWAATESRAIGYGGDALVSDATGLSRPTIRKGRGELGSGGAEVGRIVGDAQMAVQLHRRDPFLVLGHEVDGLKPHREGQLGGSRRWFLR